MEFEILLALGVGPHFLRSLLSRVVLTRADKSKYYDYVMKEIENGKYDSADMARSLAKSGGDEAKARGIYIEERTQSLINEAFKREYAKARRKDDDEIDAARRKRRKENDTKQNGENRMIQE